MRQFIQRSLQLTTHQNSTIIGPSRQRQVMPLKQTSLPYLTPMLPSQNHHHNILRTTGPNELSYICHLLLRPLYLLRVATRDTTNGYVACAVFRTLRGAIRQRAGTSWLSTSDGRQDQLLISGDQVIYMTS